MVPDFKTITNFRKANGKAIRGLCRQFVAPCQQNGLFSEVLVAIDGSKFKAVNNRVLSGAEQHQQKRTMPIRDWKAALNRFSIQFEDRLLSV